MFQRAPCYAMTHCPQFKLQNTSFKFKMLVSSAQVEEEIKNTFVNIYRP